MLWEYVKVLLEVYVTPEFIPETVAARVIDSEIDVVIPALVIGPLLSTLYEVVTPVTTSFLGTEICDPGIYHYEKKYLDLQRIP